MSGKGTLVSGAAIGTLLVIALVAYYPISPPLPHTPGLTDENIKKLTSMMKAKDIAELFGYGLRGELPGELVALRGEGRSLLVTLDTEGYAKRYTISDDFGAETTIELEQTWLIKVQRWFRE